MNAKTVDEFLAAVPQDKRAALEDLRRTLRDLLSPDFEEAVVYGVPAFKKRVALVSYAAAKDYCSFYVMSPAVMEAHKEQLRGFKTSKGSVHFTPEKPLPRELVASLVRARLAEAEAPRKK